jgi:hypothetical protein
MGINFSFLPTAIAVKQFRKFSQCSTIAAMINAATRPPTIRNVILSFVSITLPSQAFRKLNRLRPVSDGEDNSTRIFHSRVYRWIE